jgi:phosphoribosyl-ATP pyrophosphohydrolase
VVTQTPLLPLILTQNGKAIAYLLGNQKAYEKSLEHNEIWFIHPATLRLISLEQSQGCTLLQFSSHYEAEWIAPQPPTLPDITQTAEPPQHLKRESNEPDLDFFIELTQTIRHRRQTLPEGSYTTHLFQKGEAKIRKKLGEEAVELVLAQSEQEIVSEAADLVYHLLVFLEAKNLNISEVIEVLKQRH